MRGKGLVLFVSGLVTGALGGIFGAKVYYQKKLEKNLDQYQKDLEEYYGRTDEYVRDSSADRAEEAPSGEEKESNRVDGPLSNNQRREIREKLLRNQRETTNYAGMYRKDGTDISEEDEELDDQESEEEEPTPEELAGEDHARNREREPRIISAEKLGEIPSYYENQTLFYYLYDDTLTEEEGEVVEDPYLLVGDCLDKYGFRENDEMLILVQNFALDTIYEVQKVRASYGEYEG